MSSKAEPNECAKEQTFDSKKKKIITTQKTNEGQKRKQIGVFFVTSKMQKALNKAIDHEIARLDYATNVVLNLRCFHPSFFKTSLFPFDISCQACNGICVSNESYIRSNACCSLINYDLGAVMYGFCCVWDGCLAGWEGFGPRDRTRDLAPGPRIGRTNDPLGQTRHGADSFYAGVIIASRSSCLERWLAD